jgi:tripartite-type tricarboxylate transporter receptor subunit TctC
MPTLRRRTLLCGALASALPCAWAQGYPDRTIRLVVPFAAGGGFDAIVRPFAEKLSAVLGQAVIVDNRPGAGGAIGTDFVTRAVPDGYTLLFANSSIVTQPLLQKKTTYDPATDLVAVSRVGAVSTGLAVNPKLPANNLAELIELSKRRPLNFGTPGTGTAPHLVGELLNLNGTMRLVHVPYKGTGPAMADAVSGQIDMVMAPVSATAQLVRSGKLRGIAVLSPARSSLMPELPTFLESGLPDVQGETWYGVFAPARVPAAVIRRLNEAAGQVLAQPEFMVALRKAGYEPQFSTSAALAETVRADQQRWARVVREAKLQME